MQNLPALHPIFHGSFSLSGIRLSFVIVNTSRFQTVVRASQGVCNRLQRGFENFYKLAIKSQFRISCYQ